MELPRIAPELDLLLDMMTDDIAQSEQRNMTRRLLIIDGMMSAFAAAGAGAFSAIMATERVIGLSSTSHYSAGVHFLYGRQDLTWSLIRKSAVALATMPGCVVTGGFRPPVMRVVAGPGEVSEFLDRPESGVGSLAPKFRGQYSFLEHRRSSCRGRAHFDRPTGTGTCRKDSRGERLSLHQAARKVAYRAVASSITCAAVTADVLDRQIFTRLDDLSSEEGQQSLAIHPRRNAVSVAVHWPWSTVRVHKLTSARLS